MPITRIILYARDLEVTVAFYERHFAFVAQRMPGDRIVSLVHPSGGATLMIHAAGKAQKFGQSTVKLVFDFEEIENFRQRVSDDGLLFGPIHLADGYSFANARDPDGNPISISSRAFRGAASHGQSI